MAETEFWAGPKIPEPTHLTITVSQEYLSKSDKVNHFCFLGKKKKVVIFFSPLNVFLGLVNRVERPIYNSFF